MFDGFDSVDGVVAINGVWCGYRNCKKKEGPKNISSRAGFEPTRANPLDFGDSESQFKSSALTTRPS